ncbi:thioredoxin family protein [Sinomicrobium soli]|uniref:thioredoxin family protein n=1 Tax=Sinomicrobium sp. N-1-3-6 TaxID=2219864 RepID=UPI000DCC74A4|nr:thioredoxin family protein [Sinomicrobium sp. N-1-3-6]RAV30597.1 thioredoxin family protein [Sinomicrobium sp. N-1-3-6]
MARTPSNMLPLGTKAAAFKLPDTVSGKTISLESIRGKKATVIMFICNHCPFVQLINPEIAAIAREYAPKGVAFAAISSNDVEHYPQDAPELMAENAAKQGFSFPYLYDETQEVAKAYDAACTPDFYVFDAGLLLVYRGQLDGARPENGIPVTGKDLREALDALLRGEAVSETQKPSIGCGIKWKKQ